MKVRLTHAFDVSNNGFSHFFAKIRIVTLIACLGMMPGSEAIEALTLRDGRVLTGVYDEKANKIEVTTGELRAWINVPADQISKRELIQAASRERTAADERIPAEEAAAKQRQQDNQQRLRELEAAATADRQAREQREAAAALMLAQGERQRAAAAQAKADAQQRQRDEAAERQRASERAAQVERERKALALEQQQRMAYQAAQEERDAQRRREAEQEHREQLESERARVQWIQGTSIVLGGVIALIWWIFPWVVARQRRHRFLMQIGIVSLSPVLLLVPLLILQPQPLTTGICAAFLVIAWLACLLWATWPGLGQTPREPIARRRIPAPRPEPKT